MKKSCLKISILACLFLFGCGEVDITSNKAPETISELAYDKENSYDYRIYLEEDGELTSFLVLTSNDNNSLVLREHLLDEFINYNDTGEYGSYYAESNVDNYLTNIYWSSLSEKVQQTIIPCEIEITSKEAIDTHEKKTETINRNVFLLSVNELNASLNYSALKEGEPLTYFKKPENIIATLDNNEPKPWLLRTPALRDSNTVFGVSDTGVIGMGGVNDITGDARSGVRPAFYIPNNTPIIETEFDGETVFCLK